MPLKQQLEQTEPQQAEPQQVEPWHTFGHGFAVSGGLELVVVLRVLLVEAVGPSSAVWPLLLLVVVWRALVPGLLNVGRVVVESVAALAALAAMAAMVTKVEVQARSHLPATRNFPPGSH